MKIQVVILIMIFSIASFAQEEAGEISAPAPSYDGSHPSVFTIKGIFDSFRNQSFRSSGILYGAEIGFESLNEYSFYLGSPFIYGQIQEKNVSEMGNPYVGGDFLLMEPSAMQLWLSGEHRFARYGAAVASRHNTAIPGFDLRYEKFKTVASIGGDYHWRYGEADTTVDIKDIISAHLSLGRKFSRRLTLSGEVLWFRALGVKKGEIVMARESDWAGVGPVANIRLGSGVVMKSSLIFPVHLSRSQAETEVAVWDSSLPKVNEVTWKTDLGVQF